MLNARTGRAEYERANRDGAHFHGDELSSAPVMSDFYHSGYWIRKTRKPHSCGWCDRIIIAGSAAHYSAGVFEGDFYSQHLHPECAAARDSMSYRDLEDGWSPGDFARGRRDDDGKAPMQGSQSYRGFLVT